MANASVVIYNAAREPVADLHQAFDVGYEQRINELHRAWFSLPYDDPHLSEVTGLRYAEIYSGDERVDLFRIIKKYKRGTSEKTYYRFECEHVFATLMNDEVKVTLNSGPGSITSIGDVLALQGTVNWALGSSDFDRQFLYTWEPGTSLLEAMADIPARFGCSYQWTFDTSSYPWTVNLIEPPATVSSYLDRGRNLLGVDEEEDYTQIVTRLYPYGNLAGADQLDITSIEPSGNAYVSTNVATYGLIERIWVDQRYSVAQNLYDAAVSLIAEYSVPRVKYSVAGADLYSLSGESIDEFVLGALVEVTYDDLDISVQARIVGITKSDVNGAPGDVGIQVANKSIEFDFRDAVQVNDLSALQMIDIPGGVVGALPAAPSAAGLYASTSYLGFSDGTDWRAYFDIDGKFKLVGDATHYLTFDPDAVVPLIIHSDGEWIGSVSISHLTAGDLTVEMNLDTGGSVKSDNYVAGTTGWQIDHDGSAEFSNVTVRGVVEAATGTIGGWTIAAGLLSVGGVGMRPADYPFFAGNANPASAEFRVTAAGALYATGATISGAVTATSGTIGGFTISATTLYSGTNIILNSSTKAISINSATFGQKGVQLEYNAGTPRFYVGDASSEFVQFDGSYFTWGSANTSMNTNGDLTVHAKITMKNDTFGNEGIQLDYNGGTPKVYIGDGSNAFFKYDVALTWKAANTELDVSGNLTATAVDLTGAITASTGSIGGWTITAGLLATGDVGMRPADYPFFAGNADPSLAEFNVTAAGVLTAAGATIDGTLTITSGYVGNIVVDASGLDLTANGRIVAKKAGTDDDPWGVATDWEGIWIGKDGSDYKLFAGDEDDEYFMWDGSALTISGDIYVVEGTIGGWTITAGLLANGDVGMAPATYPFYAGDSTPEDAEFSVDTSGNVIAESIAISGTFTVTGYSSGTDDDPWDVTTADWKGIWLGKNSGKYKLFIGNEASQYLSWDDTTLSISGVVTIDDDGMDLGTDGRIVGKASGTGTDPFGETDWVGTWLGPQGSSHKFFIGDQADEYIMFDGTDLTVKGDLEMIGGSIVIVNAGDTIWINDTAGELRIGGTSYAAAPFQVSAAGALEATSGEIGGVTIGTDRLTIGSGLATAGIIKGEANGIAFYAGSATPSSAQFWVKTDGSMRCGDITAYGGTVGGFTIATHLYTGSKTAYGDGLAGVHVGTDGIGLGANFKVSAAGVLTCSGASISGSLDAGDIDSGTMNFSYITQNSVDIISTMMHNNSVGTAAIVNNSVNVDKIYINGTVVFNADGSYHNITGISDLRGPVWSTSHWGQIGFPTGSTGSLTIECDVTGGDSITLNSSDGTEYGVRIYAPNGVIRFVVKDASTTALAFENWYSSGGASTYSDKGAIKVRVGATTRYIRLFESYSA